MIRKAVPVLAVSAALLGVAAVPAQAADRGIPAPQRVCKILTPLAAPVRVLHCNTAPTFVVQLRRASGWVTVFPR